MLFRSHALTAAQVRQFGFRFAADNRPGFEWSGSVKLNAAELDGKVDKAALPEVRDMRLNPVRPRVGERCEIAVELQGYIDNPFDPAEFKVDVKVQRPDGKVDEVAGFYYEGFVSEPEGLKERLIPQGRPEWRVRYLPRVQGAHSVKAVVSGRHGELSLPDLEFEAQPARSDYRGFVRVDPENPLYMEYENGDIFHGIGLNVRTPTDTRYLAMAPFSSWRDEGVDVYRRMFPKLAAAGVDTVEVWMSSWWLALEWINDAPGFHGVGYYNQYRAWLLDEIVRLAEKHDIYLILVLNNHGKFSSFIDKEWSRNPYNRQNGGWLTSPDHYFSDERARQAFRNTADYIVARWGYSPNMLCWKLFSEINLTGSSSNSYKQPFMINWHRDMSRYLKKIDPYNHMVTTHWSTNYHLINDAIAEIDTLDFLTTDAYDGSTRQIVDLFDGTVKYGTRKGKPALITEFGGSPMGDTLGTLKKQFHLSLWKGFFGEHAFAPMFWWFEIVEEQNLYTEYAAFAAVTEGVDRREMKRSGHRTADGQALLDILNSNDTILVWGWDQSYYYSRDENNRGPLIDDISIKIGGLVPDNYTIEIWDCYNDTPLEKRRLKVHRTDQKFNVQIPPFRRNFALKVTPSKDR